MISTQQARELGKKATHHGITHMVTHTLNNLCQTYFRWTWFLIFTLPVTILQNVLHYFIDRATSLSNHSLTAVQWNTDSLEWIKKQISARFPIKLSLIDKLINLAFAPALYALAVMIRMINVSGGLLSEAKKHSSFVRHPKEPKGETEEIEIKEEEIKKDEEIEREKELERIRKEAEHKQKLIQEKLKKTEQEKKEAKKRLEEEQQKHEEEERLRLEEQNRIKWENLRLKQELEKVEQEQQEKLRLEQEEKKKQAAELERQRKLDQERIRTEEVERLRAEELRIKQEKKKLKKERKNEEARLKRIQEEEERVRRAAEEKQRQLEEAAELVRQAAEAEQQRIAQEEERIRREKEEYERKQQEDEKRRKEAENISNWKQLALKQELEKAEEKNKHLEEVIVKEEKREERKEIKKQVLEKKKQESEQEAQVAKLQETISKLRTEGSEKILKDEREKIERKKQQEEEIEAKRVAEQFLKIENKPSLESLIDRIRKNDAELKELDLQGYYVVKDELKQLVDVAVKNTNLIELDLTNNTGIRDGSVKDLARLIEQNKTIRRLYLEGTKITDISLLVSKMQHNHTLVDVTVPEEVSDESLNKLNEMLDRNEQERNKSLAQALAAQ